MSGSHYTLSRDQAVPPPKNKVCRTCGQIKQNDFDSFPKVLDGRRDKFRTAEVCKQCKNDKISQTMKDKHGF